MDTDTEVELEELHSPTGILEEKKYEFEGEQGSKVHKILDKFKITSERKKKVLKVSAVLLALFLVATVLLSSTFGAGFGVGFAVNNGGDSDNSNNNNNNDNNNNNNDDNNNPPAVPPPPYDYYQGDPYVYHSPDDYQLDRTNQDEAVLLESNEYQFKLNTTLFTDRMKGVRQLLVLLRMVLNITIDEKDADEDYFTETQYKSTDCGAIDYSELRIRNYIDGKLDSESESDINKDASPHSSKENAMSYDLEPNSKYDNEQKIEQDVHPCWYKFNKKTKVKSLPNEFKFVTCADVVDLFPYSFPEADLEKPITTKGSTYFWEYKFKGHMQGGVTKYKLSFNLAYKSMEAAQEGTTTPVSGESEFSIRMYSPGDGLLPWNYKLLAEMGENYLYLLDNYGSLDYPCKS